MGACAVGMIGLEPDQRHEGSRWDHAGIRRAMARLGKVGRHDPRGRLPRSDPIFAQAADGRGMTWEEDGRTVRAQAWCPGPYVRSYWYLVWESSARFPGELVLMMSDREGHVWIHDGKAYDARGRLR